MVLRKQRRTCGERGIVLVLTPHAPYVVMNGTYLCRRATDPSRPKQGGRGGKEGKLAELCPSSPTLPTLLIRNPALSAGILQFRPKPCTLDLFPPADWQTDAHRHCGERFVGEFFAVGDKLVAVNDEAIANLPLSRIQARFKTPSPPPSLTDPLPRLPGSAAPCERCSGLGGVGGGLLAMLISFTIYLSVPAKRWRGCLEQRRCRA